MTWINRLRQLERNQQKRIAERLANKKRERACSLYCITQNNSVLHTAKVSNSVKIERQANSKIMAANSRISKVYVQANYGKEKHLQKIIRLLQNRDTWTIT